MKIAIRADASASIGLGHIKRCLSLAQALRDEDAEVLFFVRATDVDAAGEIARRGFDCHAFADGPVSDANAERDDARAFIASSRSFEPDAVLADHYALGASWHRAVHEGTGAQMAAIDDLGDRPMAVDLLIDPNLASDHAAKHARHGAAPPVLLGGPGYALLAPAYADALRGEPRDSVASIGIFMGGTDEADLSSLALAVVRDDLGFRGAVEIATTSGNPHLAALRAKVAADPGTQLTVDQPDLAAFYARHDLHLGAGGGATWERCCLGAPTLALLAAPNQREVLLPLQNLGVMRVVTAEPPRAADIAPPLRELIVDAALRHSLSVHGRELVDGLGARRVARRLLDLDRPTSRPPAR